MSVDVESWVHRPVFDVPLSEQTKELDGGHVMRSTEIILELFKRYEIKATFFVLGTVAEWYPELIENIRIDGHEIGIHGYSHKRLLDHSRESFTEEIEKTVLILQNLGVSPRGYRSPSFTKADFLYEVLRKNGIAYDSSVMPVKTPLYDGTAHDCHPFYTKEGILEVPCSVLNISGLRLPAGGFYLRLLGSRINYRLLKTIENKYGVAVMYFHPWEVLEIPETACLQNSGKTRLPFLKRRFAYYKIPMVKRLEYLMRKIHFTNFDIARKNIEQILNINKSSE